MIGAVLLGAALVAGGIGIGYLLFGEDDEPTAAAPVETTGGTGRRGAGARRSA
jgi:hypothetical protein